VRSLRNLSLVPLAAACLGLAAAPAAAGASTVVAQPSGVNLTITSSPQGAHGDVLWPGDTFDLQTRVQNSDSAPANSKLTGVTGTLSGAPNVLQVTGASATFPDIDFGFQQDSTPFTATLAQNRPCGAPVPVSLALASDQGTANLAYSIPTGTVGAPKAYEGGSTAQPIPDGGSTFSTMTVGEAGYVKHLRVRIGQITHTYDQDLKIQVVSPDGTTATLAESRGGAGHDFTNTTFDDQGPVAIGDGSAPFTGTYRPEQPLSVFDGKPSAGTWRIEVTDQARGANTGALGAAGIDISPAVCQAGPLVSLKATPAAPLPAADVTLDAGDSRDATGTITKYAFDLDGDGSYETDNGSSPVLTRPFARGAHHVGVQVTDSNNATGVAPVDIVADTPPTAAATSSSGAPASGSSVTLDASGSATPDTGGSIVHYEWDLDGNGSYETDGGPLPTTIHSFSRPGPVDVGLRVTDDLGLKATSTVHLDVANRAPAAALAATPNPALTTQTVLLDAAGSQDPDGSIVRYDWDLNGDGVFEQTSTDPTLSHRFTVPGHPVVRVRVTDDLGLATVAQTTLTVNQPPAVLPPPPGGHGPAPFAGVLGGSPIQRVRTTSRHGVALTCRANKSARCSLKAQLTAGQARRLKLSRHTFTVASRSFSLTAERTATVRLRMPARMRRALGRTHMRSVALLITGTVRDTTGHTVRVSRVVLLRR
jgi:subtilisin-like proprotein convertase family protein